MSEFIKEVRKRVFPTIIAISALSVSISAAFYSVTGLSKLFAGASFEVMIMAGSLEFAKLVIASLLYQYWGQLNRVLRVYLSIATLILIIITSAGIYGFLSAAYQETATKSGIVDSKIEVYNLKKGRYLEDRTYYLSEKKTLDEGINSLRDGLANNTIQYKDKETGQIITTTSSSTRRALQRELESALKQRTEVSKKIEIATDSINSIAIKVLDVSSSSEIEGELGPLKYLSELTGSDMNSIINVLLLVIIFVFDPLAIALVVAANFAFDRVNEGSDDDEGPKPLRLSKDQLNKLENTLNKKVMVSNEEVVSEPDSEQEVFVNEEDIEDESNYDEEFFEWDDKVKEIEVDFEEFEVVKTDLTERDQLIFAKGLIDDEDPTIIPFTEEEEMRLWNTTLNDGLDDEDHVLDMVMNDMVKDMTEDDIKEIIEENSRKEVTPPKKLNTISPYLRVGNKIIPRNVRYRDGE